MKRNLIQTFATLVFMLPFAALATSYSLSPIRIDLGPTTPDSAVTIQNEAEKPVSIQVRAYAWTMDDGKDVLEPTRDILIAPSIVTIEPHGRQVVRAALRTGADSTVEKTYRVFFTEIPRPDPTLKQQVQMTLNMTIPLFVKPASATPPAYKALWNATISDDGKIHLSLLNDGSAHFHMHDFRVKSDRDASVLFSQHNGLYVLPKAKKSWTFPAGALAPASLDLSYEHDDGTSNATVPVGR